jgi:hypothetical protein
MSTPKTAADNTPTTSSAATPPSSQKVTSVAPKRAPRTAVKKVPNPSQASTPAEVAPAQAEVKKALNAKSKVAKEKKVKVVRDSFTIPKTEFAQIAEMKKRAMTLGVEVKKSELIRAGLQLISGLPDAAFKKALAGVPTLKTGRPAKN